MSLFLLLYIYVTTYSYGYEYMMPGAGFVREINLLICFIFKMLIKCYIWWIREESLNYLEPKIYKSLFATDTIVWFQKQKLNFDPN